MCTAARCARAWAESSSSARNRFVGLVTDIGGLNDRGYWRLWEQGYCTQWYRMRNGAELVAFGSASHLGSLNSSGFDARPTISWDGTQLYFSSNRAGSESPAPDIWVTERSRPGR